VGRQIQRGGVGMDPRLFQLLARITGHGADLKAGRLQFETGVTPLDVIDKLAKGEVTHYVVTVIEGWEFRKMRAAVDANPALKHDTQGMSDADLRRSAHRKPRRKGCSFPIPICSRAAAAISSSTSTPIAPCSGA
jgi:UPF0755 protein